jgi:4-amino-4-deoxy-L-arabinose transferase-like glycosyltransferase
MPPRRKTRTSKQHAKAAARPPVRTSTLVALICIAYVAIAAWYAAGIPFGQAPDESAHLPYVAYLADHGTLPIFRPGVGSYEYHQAPLYYAAAAPAYLIGRTVAPGHQYLAVRLFGILLGLCVVWFSYLLAQALCPGRRWLSVGVAGFVAFLPMHVALSASVTNDIGAEVPFAAGLWQIVVAMRDGWNWRRTVVVGVLCGLAVLMKSSGLALLPVAWLAVLLTSRQAGARGALARIAAVTVVALAVCGWWLVRNWMLYGDPLAWGAFMEAFKGAPTRHSDPWQSFSTFNYVLVVIGWTFASFWGVFGTWKPAVFMPTWGVYMPLAVVTAAGLGGLWLELVEGKSWDRWRKRAAWVLTAAFALVLASFIRFNLSFFQAQGRYLFLALPVIAIALVAGWGRLFPERLRAAAYFVLWLGMLALSAVALPEWILPALGGR